MDGQDDMRNDILFILSILYIDVRFLEGFNHG